MTDRNTRCLVLGALFAALCTVMTLVIQIPSPMQGYVNLGDCAVLLSGWLLGPVYGGAAAGTGCMLADLLSGYAHYAPGTFLIKGATAAAAGLLLRGLSRGPIPPFPARLISAAAAESIMVLGYFGYACLLLGKGLAAAASVPGNVVQGVAGLAAATAVCALLGRGPYPVHL